MSDDAQKPETGTDKVHALGRWIDDHKLIVYVPLVALLAFTLGKCS